MMTTLKISNCTAVTARIWPYQPTAAHYHGRYALHRTHSRRAQQSKVTYNRRGAVVCLRNHYCRGKAISMFILIAWVTSFIHHAKPTVPCLDLHIFHIITQTARIREKFIKRNTCS